LRDRFADESELRGREGRRRTVHEPTSLAVEVVSVAFAG
jgi:hypothetical protein